MTTVLPTIMPTLKLGMTYVIAAFAATNVAETGVALCRLPDNEATPFVTYRVDREGNCVWGHYYESEDEAWGDYQDRLNTLHKRAMEHL